MSHQQLHFLLLLPILHFSFIRSNGSVEYGTNSTNCPSHNCGGVTIAYPFWLQEDSKASSQQYCGYPGFGVSCRRVMSTGTPVISLPGDTYHIRNISYLENHTITLVDDDVANQTCPRPRNNFTLSPNLSLHFSSVDLNLTFHFNCTNSFSSTNYLELPCFRSGGNLTYVTTGDDHEYEDSSNWFQQYREEKVVTKVIRDEISLYGEDPNLIGAVIGEGFGKGFLLDWFPPDGQCIKCEDSGGWCSYRYNPNPLGPNDFLCVCSDGDSHNNLYCKGGKSHGRKYATIGAATGFILLVVLVVLVMFFYLRRRQKRHVGSTHFSRSVSSYPSSTRDVEKAGIYQGVHIFKYSELEKATHHFDPKNELGDGGFGTVYQGKLKDGRTVAVKRLNENNYKRVEQFMNEVEILACLRHQHLVSLYGCTTHHGRELLLVYEFVPNGTIADHLHGEHAKPSLLTWTTRMNIAVETADALAYLHASEVIHRDVKTNNILLDNNFCVKVADFGLSRLFPTDVTHVSTAPQGTPGYVDPEYHECYHLTSKSDVFSFGVVLIELISSKPAVDITRHRHEINLSNMAINKIRSGALQELVDPSLGYETDNTVRKMINSVAELAFQCLQSEREMRPTMEEVVEVLRGIQSEDKERRKLEDLEISRDDAALLKDNPPVISPDSVAAKWNSTSSTASNPSG